MEKLFSLEILVKTILFYTDKIKNTPRSADIEIDFAFGDKIYITISRDPIDKEEPSPTPSETEISRNVRVDTETIIVVINAGKSVVFPTTTEEMKELFERCQYWFKVRNRLEPHVDLGTAMLKPDMNALTYALETENQMTYDEVETEKPNQVSEAMYLHTYNGDNIGIIEVFFRVNNFGPKVQTKFQIINPEKAGDLTKTYYFKNDRCKAGFHIQKTGSEFDPYSLPMAPVLGTSELEGTVLKPLFITPFQEHASIMVSAFKVPKPSGVDDAATAMLQKQKVDELTPSKIRRLLCGHQYCPVALKFRDLGLGPFAPLRPGLGAPTGRETPITAYGTTQMYGNMDQYGPYGLLREKPNKCKCLDSREEIPPCGCLDQRSDLGMKPVCGFGTCPFAEKQPEKPPCCMKDSKESVFFIHNYIPPKKQHCLEPECTVKPDKEMNCACMACTPTGSNQCRSSGCQLTKKKTSCDCQRDRLRGGTVKPKSKKEFKSRCPADITIKCDRKIISPSQENARRCHCDVKYCEQSKENVQLTESILPSQKMSKNVKSKCSKKISRLRAGMDLNILKLENETVSIVRDKNQSLLSFKKYKLSIYDTETVNNFKVMSKDMRLRAGMDVDLYLEKAIPRRRLRKFASFLQSKFRHNEFKSLRNLEDLKQLGFKEGQIKFENCQVRLRAGMDNVCGGQQCCLQDKPAGCGAPECKETEKPIPKSCGGDLCPVSDTPKKPRISYNFVPKPKPDFEPFYFKPVPRVSFKKNGGPSEMKECCDEEGCCQGPAREPISFGQKIPQSYGFPGPTEYPNFMNPVCLGGETPCAQAPTVNAPTYELDPMKHSIPRCLGGRSPCKMHEKDKNACTACQPGGAPRRPSYAFNPDPTQEPSPCGFSQPRGNREGTCGMPQGGVRNQGMSCLGSKWDDIHGFDQLIPNREYNNRSSMNQGYSNPMKCDDVCSGAVPKMEPAHIFQPKPCNMPSCLYEPQFRSDLFDRRGSKASYQNGGPNGSNGRRPSYPEQGKETCEPCGPKPKVSSPCETEYMVDGIPVCGNEVCEMFELASPYATDPICGGRPCPVTHRGAGMLDEDRPGLFKREITLENCGSPTCPLADFDNLAEVFKKLTADDACQADDCPFNLGKADLPEIDCGCADQKKKRSSLFLDASASSSGAAVDKESSQDSGPCTKETCKKMRRMYCPECGGYTISGATCLNPNVPYDPNAPAEVSVGESRKKKRRDRKSRKEEKLVVEEKPRESVKVPKPSRYCRFVYRGGPYYPGIRVGHRTCQSGVRNVPPYMGWLWNVVPPGSRKRPGWRPGVIGKTMMQRIKARREELGIPDPPELTMLVAKKRTGNTYWESSESEEEVLPRPTLTIKKKEGAYYITMNPLKDPKTLADREDPYMNCTPMQFVITRQKPPPPSLPSMEFEDETPKEEGSGKELVEGEGSEKKTGGSQSSNTNYSNSYKDCFCSDDQEIISSTSESELDIEFTTPAGLIFPENFKRKPNVVHTDIQYDEKDLTDPDLPFIMIASKKKRKVKLKY